MVVPTHTMLRAALKPVCQRTDTGLEQVSTHTMLRAALKHRHPHTTNLLLAGPDTHNAACGIETPKNVDNAVQVLSLDTHNAACGIETHNDSLYNLLKYRLDTHNAACGIDSKTALRVLSVTQSRFRMQKAHSNLDDAAHYRRTLIINTVNTTRIDTISSFEKTTRSQKHVYGINKSP